MNCTCVGSNAQSKEDNEGSRGPTSVTKNVVVGGMDRIKGGGMVRAPCPGARRYICSALARLFGDV